MAARGEVLVGEVGERLAPPQRVGLGQQRDGPLQVAGRGHGRPSAASCSNRLTSMASGGSSSA